MAMKLYTGPISLFSAKVRIAFEEKGLEAERVSVGWTLENRYLPHHPDVVGLNPRRQVPILVDGDAVVCDSTVILEYLEERFPEPALYPPDPASRARCRRLEALADEVLFPPLWDLIEESFYPAGGGGRDPRRLRSAHERLQALYRELDGELAGRAYLCDAFGVADIACFVMASAAATLGAPPDAANRQLAAWLERTGARPSCERELAGMRGFVASLFQPGSAAAAASPSAG